MIPANTIRLAQKNAQLARTRINIYQTKYSYIYLPHGYRMPESAVLVGYVTENLVFHDSGDDHETTKESGIDSD